MSASLDFGFRLRGSKKGLRGVLFWYSQALAAQTENEEPQPQVVWAFGFLITNCAPSRPSL